MVAYPNKADGILLAVRGFQNIVHQCEVKIGIVVGHIVDPVAGFLGLLDADAVFHVLFGTAAQVGNGDLAAGERLFQRKFPVVQPDADLGDIMIAHSSVQGVVQLLRQEIPVGILLGDCHQAGLGMGAGRRGNRFSGSSAAGTAEAEKRLAFSCGFILFLI